MTVMAKVAVNPLPWVLQEDHFDLSVDTLTAAFAAIAAAGFDAVHADIPAEMPVPQYRTMLAEYGLQAAPGYFAAHFDTHDDFAGTLEAARRHAADQAELGLTEVFFASHLNLGRRARPAVGAGFDPDVLSLVVEQMARTAQVITAEGVTPCLHPHVGSWVETEAEVRAVLDGIDPADLSFGPDTGHLFWAGMDPAAIIGAYADRVRAVHVKDVHRHAAELTRARGIDYSGAVYAEHVWTEPGNGDVDFDTALDALPAGFDGWLVVEVDNPDRKTKEESTAESAQWVEDQRLARRLAPPPTTYSAYSAG